MPSPQPAPPSRKPLRPVAIAALFKAGESIEDIAEDFRATRSEIENALRYYMTRKR